MYCTHTSDDCQILLARNPYRELELHGACISQVSGRSHSYTKFGASVFNSEVRFAYEVLNAETFLLQYQNCHPQFDFYLSEPIWSVRLL